MNLAPARSKDTGLEHYGQRCAVTMGNNMLVKTMTFMKACNDFFGQREGQSAMQFAQELKALTPTDKEEIKEGLTQQGYVIVSPLSVKELASA